MKSQLRLPLCLLLGLCLFLPFQLFAEQLSSGINYQVVNGVRIVENQTINATLTIDGEEWTGAIIRNNLFTGQLETGLHISNASDLTIDGNEFTEIGSYAIKLRDYNNDGAHNAVIVNNHFHDLAMTPILIGEPNYWTQITGNRFHHVATSTAGNKQHAMYVKGPGYLIEGNLIDTVVDANGISIRTAGTVRNNIIKNVNRDGIKYYSNSSKKGDGSLVIEGNLVLDSGHGGIVFANGKKALVDKVVVRFNTAINTYRALRLYEDLDAVHFSVYGNLFVEASGKYSALKSALDFKGENLMARGDIGFYDFAGGDYRPRQDSSAYAFVTLAPSLPPYDLASRSFGPEPWTAGAYQVE